MNWRALLVWTVIFLVAGGLFAVTQKDKLPRRGTDVVPGETVFGFAKNDLASVTLRHAQQDEITLKRRKDHWTLSPGGHGTDPDNVGNLLDAAVALRALGAFPITKKLPAASYGLKDSGEWYRFTLKDGRAFTLTIGDYTPISTNRYARLGDAGTAMAIAEMDLFNLRQTSQQLRDKTILDLDEDAVSTIRYDMVSPSRTVTLQRQPKDAATAWKSGGLPLQDLAMGTLLFDLTTLEAMSFPPAKTRPPGAADRLTLTLSGGGEEHLRFWRNGEVLLGYHENRKLPFHLATQSWEGTLRTPPVQTRLLPLNEYELAAARFSLPKGHFSAQRPRKEGLWRCEGTGLPDNCPKLVEDLLTKILQGVTTNAPVPGKGKAPEEVLYRLVLTPTDPKRFREMPIEIGLTGNLLFGRNATYNVSFGLDTEVLQAMRAWEAKLFGNLRNDAKP